MTSRWNLARLICPLCKLPLVAILPTESDTQVRSKSRPMSMACDNNHSFDIGKPGYLHLIPAQNKRSKEPGDNKEMIAARKRFLSKGYYQPISAGINHSINHYITRTMQQHETDKTNTSLQILDLGCGEGYYTTQLNQHLQRQPVPQRQPNPLPHLMNLYGLDISKSAIQQAAKRSTDIIWLVANSSDIPLPDNSVDIVFSIFSPIVAEECHRILAPGGKLITATAESQHLLSLRELIYDEVKHYKNGKLEEQLAPYFTCQETEVINHSLQLTLSADVLDLLLMTPHYWRTTAEKRMHLASLSSLATELSVQLQVFTTQPKATP